MKVLCTCGLEGKLTEGKVYETTGLDSCGQIPVVADNGSKICFNTWHFEGDDDEIVFIED